MRIFLSQCERNRGPRGILCTRGEKAHTSKSVSVIACDNVISKVQSAPRTQGFSEPAKNHHGVPTRYCVLVGLKDIKFSPFTTSENTAGYPCRFLFSCNFIERGPHKILCTCGVPLFPFAMAFFICNVPKAHIAPKVHRFCRQVKTSLHRFLEAPSKGAFVLGKIIFNLIISYTFV